MNNLFRKLNSFVLTGCLNQCPNSILINTNNSLLINNRSIYTFRLSNKLVKNKRTTRPKKTTNNSFPLNYEQSQFAEKIGVTKSWNSWNTCK